MENILDKIRKLMQMTTENGCSEAEMNNALARAQKLMIEYNVSEDMVEVCETDIKEEHINSEPPCYEPRDFEWNLLDLIASNYMCKTLRSSQYDTVIKKSKYGDYETLVKKYYYRLIGSNENRQVVLNLFRSCQNLFRITMHERYKEYQQNRLNEINEDLALLGLKAVKLSEVKDNGRVIVRKSNWIPSYLKGCLQGLQSKLKSEVKDILSNEVINNQYALVKVKHDALIKEYIDTNIKINRTVNTNRGKLFIPEAYREGIKDGFSNQNLKRL